MKTIERCGLSDESEPTSVCVCVCASHAPLRMASSRTLRASLMGGRLVGWCLLPWPPSWPLVWGEAMAPAEGKAGMGGGPGGHGEPLPPWKGRGGGGGGGGGRAAPSGWPKVEEPGGGGGPLSRTCWRRAGEEEWRGDGVRLCFP